MYTSERTLGEWSLSLVPFLLSTGTLLDGRPSRDLIRVFLYESILSKTRSQRVVNSSAQNMSLSGSVFKDKVVSHRHTETPSINRRDSESKK